MTHYTVYVTPSAWREIQALPGNIRQRVRRAINALEQEPRPPESKPLHTTTTMDKPNPDDASQDEADTQAPEPEEATDEQAYELHRIRLDRWRIVYAITEADKNVDILTVRKRPPYDYNDLDDLIQQLSS